MTALLFLPIYDRNNGAVNISKIIHTTIEETSVKDCSSGVGGICSRVGSRVVRVDGGSSSWGGKNSSSSSRSSSSGGGKSCLLRSLEYLG